MGASECKGKEGKKRSKARRGRVRGWPVVEKGKEPGEVRRMSPKIKQRNEGD